MLGKNSKVHIWRRDDEKWAPKCLGEHADTNPNVRASVMFWGCITYDGVGTLAVVDGNINSQKYIDILDTNLWPVIAKVFSGGAMDISGRQRPTPCVKIDDGLETNKQYHYYDVACTEPRC